MPAGVSTLLFAVRLLFQSNGFGRELGSFRRRETENFSQPWAEDVPWHTSQVADDLL
jgi:hypothetical protein